MILTYREALREGLKDALNEDKSVLLLGEDIGAYGGTFGVTKNFLQDFGELKIIDTPLSEAGFVGIAIGLALGGLRPIVEIMTVNFSLLALDQMINSMAFYNSMSGNQFHIPIIIRMTSGGERQLGAQHSNSFEGWFSHIPGLKILTPASVQDARWVMQYARKEKNPVLIFEHGKLFDQKKDISQENPIEEFSSARILKEGKDLTVISYGAMVIKCLEVAENLMSKNYFIEVIDLRILRPLDMSSIFQSIKKTKKALIVDEGWRTGGISSEIFTRIFENFSADSNILVKRLCKLEVPVPYNKKLEEFVIPQKQDIEKYIQEMLHGT